MFETDFVIVGAGSAGCVLAERLSASGRHSVTLLEAGGSDKKFWIQVPIGYGKTFYDDSVNWKYTTDAIDSLNGRTSYWPRGKVLGGSSSINAMVYIRGQAKDFDDWAERGNPGWSAKDVRPYFERFEDRGDNPTGLHVTNTQDAIHPLNQSWFDAGKQAGFSRTENFNTDAFEGFGRYDINTKNGRRHSTARAFLGPAARRSNLRIITHAHATRILFKGQRATGVEYLHKNSTHSITANREVIISAGAINSPQLLQLSGVGDPALLQQFNIPVVNARTAVGQNLQDHIAVNYYYKSLVPTMNDTLYPLLGKLKAGIEYLLTRKGLLSLSVNQCGGFVKTRPELEHPDVQLYFTPASYTKAPPGKRPIIHPDPYSAFLLSFQPCRPTSRGSLGIQSNDPLQHPRIAPDYLSTNEDVDTVLAGCRLLRRLASTDAMTGIIKEEFIPGLQVQSDEALLEDFRERSDTVFHPVSTCIMGNDADSSVVDSSLRVHGCDALRVIDASVFPNLTSGNTNGPTVMVAEKGAELLLQTHGA